MVAMIYFLRIVTMRRIVFTRHEWTGKNFLQTHQTHRLMLFFFIQLWVFEKLIVIVHRENGQTVRKTVKNKRNRGIFFFQQHDAMKQIQYSCINHLENSEKKKNIFTSRYNLCFVRNIFYIVTIRKDISIDRWPHFPRYSKNRLRYIFIKTKTPRFFREVSRIIPFSFRTETQDRSRQRREASHPLSLLQRGKENRLRRLITPAH